MTGAPVFGALDGGYRVLIDELVERSRVRWVRAGVEGLDRAERGWALRDDTGAGWNADAVILAIPAPRLARLIEDVAPQMFAAANRITSASSVVVALAVPGDTAFPECSGVLVASGEQLRSKAMWSDVSSPDASRTGSVPCRPRALMMSSRVRVPARHALSNA